MDRCLPNIAIGLLESIKVFLDLEGYLFIVGVDKGIITKMTSIRHKYLANNNDITGTNIQFIPENYLEKIFQLQFDLPLIERGRKIQYIHSLLGQSEYKKQDYLIEFVFGDNPRELKRFLNLLAFTAHLAETIKRNILEDKMIHKESDENKKLLKEYFIPELYVKWTIIFFRIPQANNKLRGNRKYVNHLQKLARIVPDEYGDEYRKIMPDELIKDDRLKRILQIGVQFPEEDWIMDRFITLTESTIADDVEIQPLLIPSQQGEMVTVYGGGFLYGEKREEMHLPTFEIDAFPVTNKQYHQFILENPDIEVPYKDSDFTREYNWDREARSYPKDKPDHPVVCVTYHDAKKYCQWRSNKVKRKEFRLPTEKEWEKAARGTDGRNYPWGDFFDFERCNVIGTIPEGIRPVTSYQYGISPFGCLGMAGNVSDWTNSNRNNDKGSRIVRGGSWLRTPDNVYCFSRESQNEDERYYSVGFRCVSNY